MKKVYKIVRNNGNNSREDARIKEKNDIPLCQSTRGGIQLIIDIDEFYDVINCNSCHHQKEEEEDKLHHAISCTAYSIHPPEHVEKHPSNDDMNHITHPKEATPHIKQNASKERDHQSFDRPEGMSDSAYIKMLRQLNMNEKRRDREKARSEMFAEKEVEEDEEEKEPVCTPKMRIKQILQKKKEMSIAQRRNE